MSYTIWLDGNRIGDTDFELRHGTDRRAGVFHPTELGITLLPGLTSMAPALLDVGRMCRVKGIDTEDPDLDIERATEDIFQTPEGHRALAAAREMSRLEVHDASGRVVGWKSMLITDMTDFAGTVARAVAANDPALADDTTLTCRIGETPVRYFISATLELRSFMRMLGRTKRIVS